MPQIRRSNEMMKFKVDYREKIEASMFLRTLSTVVVGVIRCSTKVSQPVPDVTDDDLVFPKVMLQFDSLKRKNSWVSVRLTDCTLEELNALKSVFDDAFMVAKPIVEQMEAILNDPEDPVSRHVYSRKFRNGPRKYRAQWADAPYTEWPHFESSDSEE